MENMLSVKRLRKLSAEYCNYFSIYQIYGRKAVFTYERENYNVLSHGSHLQSIWDLRIMVEGEYSLRSLTTDMTSELRFVREQINGFYLKAS